eukprot:649581-Amphidinium_carterae.1
MLDNRVCKRGPEAAPAADAEGTQLDTSVHCTKTSEDSECGYMYFLSPGCHGGRADISENIAEP